jgi:hypothetical protein
LLSRSRSSEHASDGGCQQSSEGELHLDERQKE